MVIAYLKNLILSFLAQFRIIILLKNKSSTNEIRSILIAAIEASSFVQCSKTHLLNHSKRYFPIDLERYFYVPLPVLIFFYLELLDLYF